MVVWRALRRIAGDLVWNVPIVLCSWERDRRMVLRRAWLRVLSAFLLLLPRPAASRPGTSGDGVQRWVDYPGSLGDNAVSLGLVLRASQPLKVLPAGPAWSAWCAPVKNGAVMSQEKVMRTRLSNFNISYIASRYNRGQDPAKGRNDS